MDSYHLGFTDSSQRGNTFGFTEHIFQEGVKRTKTIHAERESKRQKIEEEEAAKAVIENGETKKDSIDNGTEEVVHEETKSAEKVEEKLTGDGDAGSIKPSNDEEQSAVESTTTTVPTTSTGEGPPGEEKASEPTEREHDTAEPEAEEKGGEV